MRGWLTIAIAGMLGLAGCAPAPAGPTPPPPTTGRAAPAMWMLADKDTRIYLLGTIHLLPKDVDWVTPAIEKAAQESSELVLEVADVDDPASAAEAFRSLAISPELPPLAERVDRKQREALDGLVNKSGMPPIVLDRLETWAAAITLSASMLRDVGLSTDLGVERVLSAQFKRAGKPVSGLETSAQQLGYFDQLPERAQRIFLSSLVEEQGDMRAEFEKMIAAWARGDVKAIALTFDDELRLSRDLSDVLIRKRNRNWTNWLDKRMDQPGTILVAVGAGHLAGRDSVQGMLARRGLKAVRVQ